MADPRGVGDPVPHATLAPIVRRLEAEFELSRILKVLRCAMKTPEFHAAVDELFALWEAGDRGAVIRRLVGDDEGALCLFHGLTDKYNRERGGDASKEVFAAIQEGMIAEFAARGELAGTMPVFPREGAHDPEPMFPGEGADDPDPPHDGLPTL